MNYGIRGYRSRRPVMTGSSPAEASSAGCGRCTVQPGQAKATPEGGHSHGRLNPPVMSFFSDSWYISVCTQDGIERRTGAHLDTREILSCQGPEVPAHGLHRIQAPVPCLPGNGTVLPHPDALENPLHCNGRALRFHAGLAGHCGIQDRPCRLGRSALPYWFSWP